MLAFVCVVALWTPPAQAQTPESGHTYRLISQVSGKAVTNGNSTENNAPITVADIDADAFGQQWTIHQVRQNTDIFVLYNATGMKGIDMTLTNDQIGILQWSVKADDNQQIRIQAVEGATDVYQLVCAADPSQLLAEVDGEIALASDATSEATHFRFVDLGTTHDITSPAEGFFYQITTYSNGKALSTLGSAENNANIYTEEPNEADAGQWWRLVSISNSATTFQFLNETANKAIDMAIGSGKNLLLWTPDASNLNQQITFSAVDGLEGVYQFTGSSKYATLQSNGQIKMADDGSSEATYFRLKAVAGPEIVVKQWEDETIFGENKEPAHAVCIPYATTADLLADSRFEKPWLAPEKAQTLDLNGTWKLNWVDAPEKRPGETDFYGDDVDVTDWADIQVPGCLEMQGFGDPMYINDMYPFQNNPPYISMTGSLKNSVASYRRTFSLPEGWDAKRVFIHFDGIYSAAFVWVNGTYIGYTQGANNSSEFDVTAALRTGENNVSVQVFRWSDGSYIEDQDMFRMSGIHRDVYLVATPKTFVRDHYITSELNAADSYQSGTLRVALTIDNRDAAATQKQISVKLLSPNGEELVSEDLNVELADGEREATADVEFPNLENLQLWSAESPTLYTILVQQKDASGQEEAAFATKYGFRHIELKNAQLYVNGKRTFLKGVNTQDTHPLTGRTLDLATMVTDVTMMKQANINTVRCSHYPRQPKMYSLFDYYGLYVVDEADLECHFSWVAPSYGLGNNPVISDVTSWREAMIDRNVRMVNSNRNFPSIIIWSLGNESGAGQNMQSCYDAVRALDPRPIHYEGATRAYWSSERANGGRTASDFWSVMYPGVSTVSSDGNSNSNSQPYFICEYAHAMGNAVGNLQEYWTALEAAKYGVGACIWDWVDQSIYHPEDIASGNLQTNGYERYRNGSDFPGPSQANFCNNGLVSADRAWSPELTEVKKVYQYVKQTNFATATRKLSVKNGYTTRNLNELAGTYSLLEDGNVVETGSFDINSIAPGTIGTLSVPVQTTLESGKEYYLNVELRLKEDTPWAEAGYAVATFQNQLKARPATLPEVDLSAVGETERLTIDDTTNSYIVSVKNDKLQMDFGKSGNLNKWLYDGVNILKVQGGPEYADYRYVENDKSAGSAAGVSGKTLSSYGVSEDGTTATVTVTAGGTRCPYTLVYTIYANGQVDVAASFSPAADDLRRIGLEMTFPSAYENVAYYAKGPWENYNDRSTGSFVGRYTSTVADMMETYAKPQSCGNRESLRELILANDDASNGVKVETEGEVSFSVLHYKDETLYGAAHLWNLPSNSGDIYAHFNAVQKGLGNGSCGGQRGSVGVLDNYLCPSSGTKSFKLRFTPLNSGRPEGIQEVKNELDALKITYNNGKVCLRGSIEAGTTVEVYNIGGTRIAKAACTAAVSEWQIPVGAQAQGAYNAAQPKGAYIAQPKGVYIVVVKTGASQRAHRLIF